MTESRDPDAVLADLKHGADKRKAASLDIVHEVCRELSARERTDLQIATVGRAAAARGGPTAGTIRNPPGLAYQQLITAWRRYAGLPERTGRAPKPKGAGAPSDEAMLEKIENPAMRRWVGELLAERARLRAENRDLKANMSITIDQRPRSNKEVIGSPQDLLKPHEREALEEAISDDFFEKLGWRVDEKERVRDVTTETETKSGFPIYRRGYLSGLRKLLGHHGSKA